MTAHGNTYGISLDSNPSGVTIGGTTPAARNVLSGNALAGIAMGDDFAAGGTGHLIEGNFIGTDRTGNAAITQNQTGVGTAAGAGNLIAFNGSSFHIIGDGGVAIGTDRTGTIATK